MTRAKPWYKIKFEMITVPETYECKIVGSLKQACSNEIVSINEFDYFDNMNATNEMGDDNFIFCLVSRPTEKTIFQKYMLAVSLVSLIVSFAEMVSMMQMDIEYDEKVTKEEEDNDQITEVKSQL